MIFNCKQKFFLTTIFFLTKEMEEVDLLSEFFVNKRLKSLKNIFFNNNN